MCCLNILCNDSYFEGTPGMNSCEFRLWIGCHQIESGMHTEKDL